MNDDLSPSLCMDCNTSSVNDMGGCAYCEGYEAGRLEGEGNARVDLEATIALYIWLQRVASAPKVFVGWDWRTRAYRERVARDLLKAIQAPIELTGGTP